MHLILLLSLLLPILASSTSPPPQPPPRTLRPRTSDRFTEFISKGLSETRDNYLGTEIYSVSITKRSNSPTPHFTINSRWESPQRTYLLLKTSTKPNEFTWDDPEIIQEVDEESTYFPFDWEEVKAKMGFEQARRLLRENGYGENVMEVIVRRPVFKPIGSKSVIFYVFMLEGRERRIFVGVENGDVGESSSIHGGR